MEILDFIKIFLLSALPILEIRGALPIGVFIFKKSLILSFIFSFLGNVFSVFLILVFLEKTIFYLKNFSLFKEFILWREKKAKPLIEKYGKWGLLFFVALPLPFTGGWTGSLISIIFGLNFKESFFIICLGIFIAGLIVTFLSCFFGITTKANFTIF